MRGLYGKVAGEELELLRYANTWLAVRTPAGRVEYPAPDEVELTAADLEHFADEESEQVGGFWLDWELDRGALVFRKRPGRHQTGEAPCPECGKSTSVNDDGRLRMHPQRTRRDAAKDSRCAGSGFLARPNDPALAEVVTLQERKRLARQARREARLSAEQPASVDLDELDRPGDG